MQTSSSRSDPYVVRLTRLSYSYPDGTKALEGIDLDVRPGERVALVRPQQENRRSCSSQVLTEPAAFGSWALARSGRPARHPAARRSRLQDPDDQLFCPTVFEDVAFGPLNMGFPAQRFQSGSKKR
jgi:energy-coupling factor transporter ATP-binding protein EcfA2